MKAEETYRRFSQFYDAYVRDFSEDLPVYGRHSTPEDNILEVGCGTGRILLYLLERGCQVTGVDISKEMLNLATIKLQRFIDGGRLKLVRHDISQAHLQGNYNRVFVTWCTMNYIMDPVRFLNNLKTSLAPDTVVLFDLFYPLTLLYPKLNGSWLEREIIYQGQPVRMKDRRIFRNNMEKRIQVYFWEGEEISIETKRRYYSKDEVLSFLKVAGYSEIVFSDGYKGDLLPIEDSPETRSGYICRAGFYRMLPSTDGASAAL